jgi:glycosyltransferase involved in cell wall biosynthesis
VGKGWRVVVYCQQDGAGPVTHDTWQGVERVCIPVAAQGPAGTVLFDWRAIGHAIADARGRPAEPSLCLTLGYNTALFSLRLRLAGLRNVINMDGIEWRRAKWSPGVKAWFWLNDWAGCWLADHLVADHPEIAKLLCTRTSAQRISTILYGADAVQSAPLQDLLPLALQSRSYLLLVARPEPENSVLEVVRAFSARPRGLPLVVVGEYAAGDAYVQAVLAAAGPEVVFAGAVYATERLAALRCHCLAYVHGHQVGGTNPALVEALGARCAVIAHDNRFNRWVAQDAARYFGGEAGFDQVLQTLASEPHTLQAMRHSAAARFQSTFSWPGVLADYEALLSRHMPKPVWPVCARVQCRLRCSCLPSRPRPPS